MENKQRVFLYITIISAVILTAAALFLGRVLHTNSLAKQAVRAETELLAAENEALETRRSFLEADVSAKTDDSDEKERLNKQITEITDKINEINSALNTAKRDLSDAKTERDAVNAEYNKMKNGISPSKGTAKKLSDIRLLCPAQITEGRYVVSGSGTVTVTAITGSARISEKLSDIDTNSYTFDLETGERLDVLGNVTITELK